MNGRTNPKTGPREEKILFEQMVKKYQGLVFTVAYGILFVAEEAMDVTQEVFLKAFEEKDFLTTEFRQKSWLVRVTRNLSLNQKRSFFRSWRFFKAMEAVFQARDTFCIEEFLVRHESIGELHSILSTLSDEEREIITLRFTAGLSYKEIAEEMGIPSGTVMSRLSRIREKLGQSFDGEDFT